jgi:PAS domain S-box-containing protein
MGHQAEANLLALIESTEDPIWSVDLSFQLIAFNRAFARRVEQDFSMEPAVGMSAEGCLPPLDAPWPSLYGRALTEGPFRKEFTFATGRTLEMAFNPIVADGETTGISVFGKDITDQKAALERLAATSEALRTSEQRYRATFEQAAVGIVHTSLGGRFLRCNARFAEIVGYTPEEVSELTFRQITPDEDLDGSFAVLMNLTKEKIDTATWEKRYIRKDGSLTWSRSPYRLSATRMGRFFTILPWWKTSMNTRKWKGDWQRPPRRFGPAKLSTVPPFRPVPTPLRWLASTTPFILK